MKFGETLASPQMRIDLRGRVRIEAGGGLVEERQFPGRQGRPLSTYLLCERLRPVPGDELGRRCGRANDQPMTSGRSPGLRALAELVQM